MERSALRVLLLCVAVLALLRPLLAQAHDVHFGTKSWYATGAAHAHREHGHASLPAALQSRLAEKCKLQSLYMVIRHASRWPTKKHMDKYAKLVAGNWTSAFANNALDEGLLTLHGQQEAFDLGTRVRRSYAELLSQPYHPRVFDFRSSSIPRALQTATRFAAGVFGEGQAFAVASESLQHDLHLRFHENCPRYRAHKPIAIAQSVRHALDASLQRISARVQQRLHNSTNLHAPTAALTSKSLAYLWSACKFERTALGLPDNACAFFSAQDARELEYVEDVKDFWEKGHAVNYDMTCDLVNDLAEFVGGASTLAKARFLFGHAETLLPLAARLGLFRDAEVLGAEEAAARKWRSGVVAPFAANLAAAVYLCEGGARVVDLRHNERSLDMAHLCGGESLCSLQGFVNALKAECSTADVCVLSRLAEDQVQPPT